MAQRIFVTVNVEVGIADKAVRAANDDNELMRHELLEALIRIACCKFNVEKHAAAQPEHASDILADALHDLLREHLLHLPHDVLVDDDEFRRRKLYTEDVDRALLKHEKHLKGLFELYAGRKPDAGKHLFTLDEWIRFVDASGLFCKELSRTEATHAFIFGRMRFVDQARKEVRALSWVSFLEAIVRLVDRSVRVPAANHMKELGCARMSEFYEALSTRVDLDGDGRDDLARVRLYLEQDPHRSLADRVSMVLVHARVWPRGQDFRARRLVVAAAPPRS